MPNGRRNDAGFAVVGGPRRLTRPAKSGIAKGKAQYRGRERRVSQASKSRINFRKSELNPTKVPYPISKVRYRGSLGGINAGKRLEWTRNSVDIEGNVRRGSRPDIGCWESDVKPGLSLMVR